MAAKGATVSSLIELLELAGNRVELTLLPHPSTQGGVNRGFLAWQKVIVKQAEQPLDLGRVTYALAHPSAVRRLAFAWMDTVKDEVFSHLGSGHGYPTDIRDTKEYDIYIPASELWNVQWQSVESATAWILQSLKEQGVSLKEES